MDWPRKSFEMDSKDRRLFHYKFRSNTIVKLRTDGKSTLGTAAEISSKEDLLEWIEKMKPSKGETIAILASRAEDRTPGGAHNPDLLRYLPFCEEGFDIILRKFHVHGSIARAINRGHPIFNRAILELGKSLEPAIVYNCRTSHEWPGDLALSMTYFPLRKVGYSVLYGCDAETKDFIRACFHNLEDAACHPLLLIGIFAELERKRQLALVRNELDELHNAIFNSSKPSSGRRKAEGDGEPSTTHPTDPWSRIYNLKNSLESWKEQLKKIISHIDELSEMWSEFTEVDSFQKRAERRRITEIGERIKERIKEIVCDYNVKIRECEITMMIRLQEGRERVVLASVLVIAAIFLVVVIIFCIMFFLRIIRKAIT